MRLLRTIHIGVLLWVSIASLSACSEDSSASCLPPALSIAPAEVRAGSITTVSSGPFQCDGEYPEGTQYSISVHVDGQEAEPLGTVRVATDGGFSTEVTVPSNLPPGRADIVVGGSSHDECSNGESCAAYSAPITVVE